MYFVYIIESASFGRWYIGSTQDIEKRLALHNVGKVRSTKPFLPYRLVYSETHITRSEAQRREMQIKRSGIIRKAIKSQINRKAPSSIGQDIRFSS